MLPQLPVRSFQSRCGMCNSEVLIRQDEPVFYIAATNTAMLEQVLLRHTVEHSDTPQVHTVPILRHQVISTP